MRWLPFTLLAIGFACGSKADAPSPAQVAERAWRAHELVIAAGEQAATCAEAGPAMQAVFARERQAFVEGMSLGSDQDRVAAAADHVEQHDERYRAIEARTEALEQRCGHEPSVAAAFRQIESP